MSDFMTFEQFRATLEGDTVPSGIGTPLQALWLDAKGDWDQAHRLVQSDNGADAAWVHAYLHRKESDLSNALYWYARAAQPPCETSQETEWRKIVESLLP